MADYVVSDSSLASIADAIRSKGGTSAQLAFPNGFISAIQNLGGDGLTNEVKQALLQIGQKVAYIDADGQQYYNDLMAALYHVDSISAVFTQGQNTIWSDDSLDTLKQYLVVTATYENGHTETVTDYTLSGFLDSATSIITVSFAGKTTSFAVAVTLVGTTNYASADMSNVTRSNAGSGTTTGVSDGVLWLKCNNASQVTGYNVWAFDCKPTLYSTLAGKRVRVRIKAKSPDWSDELSDTNRTRFWITIYKNANVTSGSGRQDNFVLGDIAPTSDWQTYEYVTTVSSTASAITSDSTAGLCVYQVAQHTTQIASIEIVEVLN